MFFRVLLVGFGLFKPSTARAPLEISLIRLLEFIIKLLLKINHLILLYNIAISIKYINFILLYKEVKKLLYF